MSLSVFLTDLKQAKDLNAVNHALKKYLKMLDIETFAFTYYAYHPKSKHKLKYEFCSDNFKYWHHHYVEENYNDIVSTLSEAYRDNLPIFWDIQVQLKTAKNQREKKMREDSLKFGADKGITFPIHGAHDDFAVLMIEQLQGQTCLENREALQHECFIAAHYYYHFVCQHLLKTNMVDRPYNLSKREMQCLVLLAQNYSNKEISKQLDITERTVNFHAQNINKKLGTKNKYQSVLKALEEGLLTL